MTGIEKTGYVIAFVIILALLCLIVFSDNGYLDYKRLEHEKAAALAQIEKIDIANHRLEDEISGLKTDMEYIRYLAKHEHDMAEEDEFIFKEKPAKKRKFP
jgi:cell division protein FtsB